VPSVGFQLFDDLPRDLLDPKLAIKPALHVFERA
jgi:hypothetical protein